jgi:hypothetical protein
MLDHPAWEEAPWSEEFVDILGDSGPSPRFRTRMKMRWDRQALYIGAELEEPHVWGTLTEHDSVIFQDNDFEVFLDPDGDHHGYVELEINALNTTWDLLLVKPYRDGGPPVDGFELKGLKTAVHVDGTLNDPSDTDRGWSVAIEIPWVAIRQVAGCRVPPEPGDLWRINFSRVHWKHDVVEGRYVRQKGPEDNWVWAPQGVVDMHQPEHWGLLEFVDSLADPVAEYVGEEERRRLAAAYHDQVRFRKAHGRWAATGEAAEGVAFETTSEHFLGKLGPWRIDQSSRVWRAAEA